MKPWPSGFLNMARRPDEAPPRFLVRKASTCRFRRRSGAVGVLGVIPSGSAQNRGHRATSSLGGVCRPDRAGLGTGRSRTEADQIRLDIETERLRSSLLQRRVARLANAAFGHHRGQQHAVGERTSLDPEVRRELAASILDESERLNRLVANLLDMTRLQAGALEVRKQWQPIEEVIGAALARVVPATAKTIRSRRTSPPICRLLRFDDLLIQQVLVNLLENAIAHTPADTPIEISARQEGNSIVIEVADRGPDCRRAIRTACSRSSIGPAIPRTARAPAWAWPSAAASCNCTAERYKPRIARAAARSFDSLCLGRRAPDHAARRADADRTDASDADKEPAP